LLLVVLLAACNEKKTTTEQKENIKPEYVKRFFSDDSFWNQPIPKNPVIDSMSAYWISLLEQDPSGENIGVNVHQYTIPIYEVDSKAIQFKKIKQTPHHRNDGKIHTLYGHEPEFDSLGVPIPDFVIAAAGNDKHLAIIDWRAKRAWDMFLLERLDDGNWSSATGMTYPLDGSGAFKNSDFAVKLNESIHGYGPGVAAGTPIIAGVIRYDEVKGGEIRHKLSGGLRFVAFQEYVFPATWTDGNFDGGIPEGATLQLDPALDLSLFNLTIAELVVARALQEYGFVMIDFSEGSTIRAEWLGGQKDKSWDGIMRCWNEPSGIKTIPVEHYRVLKVKNIQKGGDRKKEFFTKKLYFKKN